MFRVDHAALAVQSLSRSRAFYEYLGGKVVSRPSELFVEIMLGDLRLHLVKAENGDKAPVGSGGIDHLCVSVETLEQLETVRDLINGCPLLEGKGPFAIQESPKLSSDQCGHAEQRPPRRTLYARDPDGIALEIRCYR